MDPVTYGSKITDENCRTGVCSDGGGTQKRGRRRDTERNGANNPEKAHCTTAPHPTDSHTHGILDNMRDPQAQCASVAGDRHRNKRPGKKYRPKVPTNIRAARCEHTLPTPTHHTLTIKLYTYAGGRSVHAHKGEGRRTDQARPNTIAVSPNAHMLMRHTRHANSEVSTWPLWSGMH